jgi:hypothetical protein
MLTADLDRDLDVMLTSTAVLLLHARDSWTSGYEQEASS